MASAKLSGVDEEETDKHVLLDDLVALLGDAMCAAASKRSNAADDKDKVEQGGQHNNAERKALVVEFKASGKRSSEFAEEKDFC
ncbi:hypothetical protein DYB37_012473 [Aphanomyces astaci]|uniref:Uncharacterized protein n=1 Tax=Aphanomyces astaci TaxID=112090 RepID=A0A3R6Z2Y9_APHAT|nr:hypothetical protein DYB37_012473 [Aphanomyces astaci]